MMPFDVGNENDDGTRNEDNDNHLETTYQPNDVCSPYHPRMNLATVDRLYPQKSQK